MKSRYCAKASSAVRAQMPLCSQQQARDFKLPVLHMCLYIRVFLCLSYEPGMPLVIKKFRTFPPAEVIVWCQKASETRLVFSKPVTKPM